MAVNDEKRFVENLQAARRRLGWSQGELARRMVAEGWDTYSQMTVSRTEKGERPIRLAEARDLAKVLGTTVDEMTSDVDATLERLVQARDRLRAAQAGSVDAFRALATAESEAAAAGNAYLKSILDQPGHPASDIGNAVLQEIHTIFDDLRATPTIYRRPHQGEAVADEAEVSFSPRGVERADLRVERVAPDEE